jgi:Clamp-loader complex subunit E C-terminus.
MDSDVKYELINYAAYHENKLQLGSKAIFHIEAFIARVMLICKNYFTELSGL